MAGDMLTALPVKIRNPVLLPGMSRRLFVGVRVAVFAAGGPLFFPSA